MLCAISSFRREVEKQMRSSGLCCPETSVRNYHYSLRNNPEEGRSQLCIEAVVVNKTQYNFKASLNLQ